MAVPSYKQQAYDDMAYRAPVIISLNALAGASLLNVSKFTAFTAMLLKQAQLTVTVAGTNTNTMALVKITAAGTATSTIVNVIQGTGLAGVAVAIGTTTMQSAAVDLASATLAKGDVIVMLNGTDATAQFAVGIEAYVIPGSNLAV